VEESVKKCKDYSAESGYLKAYLANFKFWEPVP
jgi:hypothetical protein